MCVLFLLVGTARAQSADMRQLRDLSARWAEYYAGVYRVPIELVEAIIDEESGWNPYAVCGKGAAGIPRDCLMVGVSGHGAIRMPTQKNELHRNLCTYDL
jgi:Transglycosylase SLT domain